MHTIEYKNAYSYWNEALPLGNGHFGTMAYLHPEKGLTFIFNHYDVYYRKLEMYARDENGNRRGYSRRRNYTFEQLKQRAIEAHQNPHHPAHKNYSVVYYPEMATSYGVRRDGYSLVISGILQLQPRSELLAGDRFNTALHIEEARVEYLAEGIVQNKIHHLRVNSLIAPGDDIFLARVSQTQPGDIDSLRISIPKHRGTNISPQSGSSGDNVFFIINSFHPDGENKNQYPSFHYVWLIKLLGASGELSGPTENNELKIKLSGGNRDFAILATVGAEEKAGEDSDLIALAVQKLASAEASLSEIENSHRSYWSNFWSHSRVTLPDKMLETLWYLHLYSLASCSGEGARLYEQACGLNGLWDIKAPTQWGSMWYWDVNIEQSFWPVFTANHLELMKPFHRGLLSYVDGAKQWAKSFYHLDGIAPDFPFDLYLCIWPWCAQFFWWYYKYSGDKKFLKGIAYPLFKDIIRFFEQYLQEDAKTGKIYIFPDVSPEQGPMTRNSTITLSCLKYLLQAAIEANLLLGEDKSNAKRWRALLRKFPGYPRGKNESCGLVIKDSEWAPANQYLAHSSLLMPIYPIGELSRKSPPKIKQLLLNTLRYADTSQAIGTHNLWLAAAAARLGLGDEGLRIIYERGISYMMRGNGMFAEESDRWIQDCLVASAPVHNPPLMEAGGVIVATINEMLLQSFDGVIEVFPAVPKGVIMPRKDVREMGFNIPSRTCGQPITKWEECSFAGLLAEGAFEVSAWFHQGEVQEIRIKSLIGGPVKVANPFPAGNSIYISCENNRVAFKLLNNVINFRTQAQKCYEISSATTLKPKPSLDKMTSPAVWMAATGRRIFLGKDENTEFYQAIDNATLDYYAGDSPLSRITAYKFDFTAEGPNKDYSSVLPPQWNIVGKQGLDFIKVTNQTAFNYSRGYGWKDITRLIYIDRKKPDCLRQDFITSPEPGEFMIELPRGIYQLLIVTGDSEEPTFTCLDLSNGVSWSSGELKKGHFKAPIIPFHHDRDSLTILKLSSRPEFRWKLCLLLLNRVL